MNCDRCRQAIVPGEEAHYCGQTLCEDCHMDAFSPTRTCDPWAVRSAAHCKDSEGASAVSAVQAKLLAFLQQTGGAGIDALAVHLGLKPADVQREIATLRHMEKVRGAMRDGSKIFRLW